MTGNDTYRTEATFYRAALLLGLVSGERVIEWADAGVARDPEPPTALIDVGLTQPGDLSAMRDALQPLADDTETVAIVHGLLGLAAGALDSGRRSVGDTVRVLAQMRRMIALPPAMHIALDSLEDNHMLAAAGVVGSVPAAEADVRAWVGQFAGAERAVLPS